MNIQAPRNTTSLSAIGFSPTDLLTPDQLAESLGLSTRTLAAWRGTRRGGPAWVKCGSLVRYRRSDVLVWLESRKRNGTEA
ncbi:MAG: helix-turn-helix domain-containing protein [Pseudomonadaceae bacterium]|nr:helix-turn-helix domain-containing protein [Pseudomonadaceae bacterium]